MQRKVYFLSFLVFSLYQVSFAWSSIAARIGSEATQGYQSSNPRVELKETRTLNQEQAEECYMFSFVGAIESANRNGWNRSFTPEISAELMFVQKLLAWAEEVLTKGVSPDDAFYFLDGGDIHHAMKLSVEKGLIPQELFKPKKPYSTWNMRGLYSDVRNIVKDGRKVLAQTNDEGLKQELLRTLIKKLQDRVSMEAGIIPDKFKWAGRDWTPLNFENAFGIKRSSHVYMLYPKGKWDMGDPWDLRKAIIGMVETFKGAFNYKQSSWSQIWNYIIGSLDNGLPVVLATKWGRSYHVLNAVGYEYNSRNEVVSLKLQNTWGEGYGDKGHAYFSPQDIEKNVTTVWGFTGP